MKALELYTLGYLLNSLWQIPLIFLAAWIGSRLARKSGPRIEHRIWVGALILEAILPGCPIQPVDAWRWLSGLLFSSAGPHNGEARIVLGPAIANDAGALHFPPILVAVLLIAYSAVLVYLFGRLAWGLWQTHLILRHSQPITLQGELAQSCVRSSQVLKEQQRSAAHALEIATSSMISGPVTVGVRRWVLLVPPGFLEGVALDDLDALIAHEFAHMERGDFAKNVFYGLLSIPASHHPLMWLTRARLAESRELVCDAQAADALAGRERYARSLLRLASMLSESATVGAMHAVAIFDTNNFERRIMDLKQKQVELRGLRRFAVLGLCSTIALTACVSALALRMDVTEGENQNPASKTLRVQAKDIKILHKQPPVYPAEAKTSGNAINGEVLLEVIIGKTGEPENIHVKKSLRQDYDQSAIDAVRNWRWEPYHLNGEPVEVVTTITIVYTLKK
ncbi:MAG TPA: M56 family metallopeptidase [Terracidiphilus sp.]